MASIEELVDEARAKGLTLPADAVFAVRRMAIPLGPDHAENVRKALAELAGVPADEPDIDEPEADEGGEAA